MEQTSPAPSRDMCSSILELLLAMMVPLREPEGNLALLESDEPVPTNCKYYAYLCRQRPCSKPNFFSISVEMPDWFCALRIWLPSYNLIAELQLGEALQIWPKKEEFREHLRAQWAGNLQRYRLLFQPLESLPGVQEMLLSTPQKERGCLRLQWKDFSQWPQKPLGESRLQEMIAEAKVWQEGGAPKVSTRTLARRKRILKLTCLPESSGVKTQEALLKKFAKKRKLSGQT